MDRVVLALAIGHLKRGEAIQIKGVKYVAEKRPIDKALCFECPMLGKATDEDASQIPLCSLCTFLDWSVRKLPYRLRIKRVEK